MSESVASSEKALFSCRPSYLFHVNHLKMVKLDVSLLRYLSQEDIRVLNAVEMGMKNHELVPSSLITSISSIRDGGVGKILHKLARHKLIVYTRGKNYDGYRLTCSGYDYLALNTFRKKGIVTKVGNEIGVGKESSVFVASNDEEERLALKIHRLGKTCFRTVNSKRDYHWKGRKLSNWIYASRLAAKREFAFMQILHQEGFSVPKAIANNRHCVVMEFMQGILLNHLGLEDVEDPNNLCQRLINMILTLANTFGLVHGDFNEFNIMICNDNPVIIDLPQMVPVNHKFAKQYFDRDVACIVDFFKKRFHINVDEESIPNFEDNVDVEGVKEKAVVIDGFPGMNFIDFNETEDNESEASEDEPDSQDVHSEEEQEDIVSVEREEEQPEPQSLNDEDCGSNEDTISIRDAASCFSVGSKSTIAPEDIRLRLKKEKIKVVHRQRLKVASKSVKGDDNAVYRKRREASQNIKEDLLSHSLGDF